jgi:ABC-type antimicrobial peptide transport system permease subunit
MEPWILMLGLGIALIMGIVGSVVPGYRLSRLNPLQSLKD